VSGEISALIAREAFEWLDGPVMRLGAPDIPAAAFAKPMMNFFVPSAEKIESAMLELARY
jgi:2-oxoisovalerate dehydrogenase E1 component beta subunit